MDHSAPVFLVLIMMIAVFSVKLVVATSCNFPPEMWCSSVEISRACKVEKQCAEWNQPKKVNDAELVNFTLYYESYCPGCQAFINGQLHSTYMAIGSIMNLTMVPYGNAQETKNGTGYTFDCQHGVIECQGNVLETCILNYSDFKTAFNTIYCMEATHDPVPYAKTCMITNHVDYNKVMACANGPEGNQLEHQMALKTGALNPPHAYVPWVTLNGVHNDNIQDAALSDLKTLICNTYQGAKPPACSQEKPKMESCIKE